MTEKKKTTGEGLANDPQPWKLLRSEYLIKRPWLTARRDHLQLPNGTLTRFQRNGLWKNILKLLKTSCAISKIMATPLHPFPSKPTALAPSLSSASTPESL